MSSIDFGEDRIAALASELTASGEEFVFFPADQFWKRFGLSNAMRSLQAEVTEKLRALGVEAVFEVGLNFADEEAQAAFTDENVQAVVESVNAAEGQTLFVPIEEFWGHFGLDDDMRYLQSIAAEKFRALGLGVTFGVVIGPLGDEDSPEEAAPAVPVSGDPFTAEKLEELAGSVTEQENGTLFPSPEVFWGHFGLPDRMAEAQKSLREQLAAVGVEVSFDVMLSVTPPELPLMGDFAAPAHPSPLDLNADTVRALSIRQPWVELILRGEKNLEYRSRRMKEMGPLLMHASRTLDEDNIATHGFEPADLPFGALVGLVDVVGCVEVEGEEGLYAYQLAHPRRFKVPVPYTGAAGIFRVPTDQVRAALANGVKLARQP